MSKTKKEQLLEANHKDGVIAAGVLNQVIITETLRPNGTLRVQQDYQFCPTLAEQHTSHLSDINYLMERYKPDEIAAYVAARATRKEIIGHDFAAEPSLQEAKNVVYRSKQEFESLDENVKKQFRSHLEFLKFVDNPANAEKLIQMGLATKKQVETILEPVTSAGGQTTTQTTQEEKKE